MKPWFKLYDDILSSPKLIRFTPQEKWAWVALLCLANRSKRRGYICEDDGDIAVICGFNSSQDWLYYRDKLIVKGMLEFSVPERIEHAQKPAQSITAQAFEQVSPMLHAQSAHVHAHEHVQSAHEHAQKHAQSITAQAFEQVLPMLHVQSAHEHVQSAHEHAHAHAQSAHAHAQSAQKVLKIAHWEELQETPSETREARRERTRAHRQRKREALSQAVTRYTPSCNALDIDIERDIERDQDLDQEKDQEINTDISLNFPKIENSPPPPPRGSPPAGGRNKRKKTGKFTESDFEEFWAVVQPKLGKARARAAFLKISQDAPDLAEIIQARVNQQELHIRQGRLEFLKQPPSWIIGERWLDDFDSLTNQTGTISARASPGDASRFLDAIAD